MVPPGLARRVEEIADAVLAHHIDPPARQQMLLDGVKALYRVSGAPAPVGLSRRVSALTAPGQFAALLAEIWPKAKPDAMGALEEAMIEGTLAGVSGGASVMSAKESAVMEQFEGNRYVGIHIALGMNDQEKRPSIFEVIEGGPADRAGVKKGDLVELIDGVDTKAMALRQAIDLLRGQEGSNVTIKVRQPNVAIARTYTIRRGQHARSTVLGYHKRPGGDWDCMLDATAPIAYLRIDQIAASTPHDLRKLARQLENRGHCGIILDVRSVGGTSVHPAVLLADTLLPAGAIGRVRTAEREVTYRADADALFRGLPIAVLVNEYTAGTAEWIVAALQDNHRATIVGSPTFGAMVATEGGISRRSDVKSRVSVGDGSWSLELVTAYLERGDGRRLSSDVTNASSSIALRRPSNPNEVTTGVKPDHPVVTARGKAETASPSQPPQRLDQKPNLANDPVVQEAVRVLRRSLQKFI
jgi:carboxyl-terminal processing protease